MIKSSIALAAVVLTMVPAHAGEQNVAPVSDSSLSIEKGKGFGRKCPADKVTINGHDILKILDLLGAEQESGVTDKELQAYAKHFDGLDTDRDGKHSKREYIENGVYMNPQARRGIFGAADNNADGFVTWTEYVLNLIITDESKDIMQVTDADKNTKITRAEFVAGSPFKDKQLAAAVFDALDSNGDDTITIPEYLRVWGDWARPNYRAQEAALAARFAKLGKIDSAIHMTSSKLVAKTASSTVKNENSVTNLKQLWSYGLTNRRTGEPLIEEGGEHKIDQSKVRYGYNMVVDRNGNILHPSGRPLHGGEKLIATSEYQEDKNVREYARVVSIMAPIRDAILYNFENTSRDKWLKVTKILRINNIKTQDATRIEPRSILSCEQVYDYVSKKKPTEGSPVMRFLEEAELELKCLAFVDFDFTNPQGGNHAKEHNIKVGSGITMP
ncbi:EF-hand domain-containing protein [Thermodesulfobacteriota bacterium]